MSAEIARCPYCVEGGEFRPMFRSTRKNKCFCPGCGHVSAPPGDPYMKCHCARCQEMDRIANRCRNSEELRNRTSDSVR